MTIKDDLGSRGTRRRVYGIISRLPMYEVTYGDGLGDIVRCIRGIISGLAPKVISVRREIGMKAFNVAKEPTGEQLGSSGLNLLKTKV